MKVLVTGSRFWPEEDRGIIREQLEKLPQPWSEITIVEGECHVGEINADKIAREEALKLGMKVIGCPVSFQWDGPWPMAGNRRNTRMLKENNTHSDPITLCLAFPLQGSSGTWDMISKCQREKIPVWVYPTGMLEN